MRDKNGNLRSKRVPGAVITDPNHWANRLYETEGGRLGKTVGGAGKNGQPVPVQRFEIERKVKDRAWCADHLPDWTS
jgi:hypothetical protein